MPSTSSQTLKLKSTLRLLIPRLRMAQKKDTSVSITSRREMSVLLSQSREASARIRVENIIQTDICVELMEILELYAELLLARAGLLDSREKNNCSSGGEGGVGVDTGLEEAAASIIYAAPRLPREVRELGIVRGLLVERFGKDFALRCSVEGGGGVVPKRVVEKLRVEAPSQELVEAYLREIARTYGVEWPRQSERELDEAGQREMDILKGEVDNEEQGQSTRTQDDDVGGGATSTNTKITSALSTPSPPKPKPNSAPPRAINLPHPPSTPRALPPKASGTQSPISVAPPAPRSDNPSPKVRLPGGEEVGGVGVGKKAAAGGGGGGGGGGAVGGLGGGGKIVVVGGKIPDVDELAERFKALKKR